MTSELAAECHAPEHHRPPAPAAGATWDEAERAAKDYYSATKGGKAGLGMEAAQAQSVVAAQGQGSLALLMSASSFA